MGPVGSLLHRLPGPGTVDYAFLDATFFKNGELPNRDMSEIPHPFVEETVAGFSSDLIPGRKESGCTSFTSTTPIPLLGHGPEAIDWVREQGFNLAEEGKVVSLSVSLGIEY
jgi:pyrroloquinoline quinone biosynthesis protein B